MLMVVGVRRLSQVQVGQSVSQLVRFVDQDGQVLGANPQVGVSISQYQERGLVGSALADQAFWEG
jgi:hypothetical protein